MPSAVERWPRIRRNWGVADLHGCPALNPWALVTETPREGPPSRPSPPPAPPSQQPPEDWESGSPTRCPEKATLLLWLSQRREEAHTGPPARPAEGDPCPSSSPRHPCPTLRAPRWDRPQVLASRCVPSLWTPWLGREEACDPSWPNQSEPWDSLNQVPAKPPGEREGMAAQRSLRTAAPQKWRGVPLAVLSTRAWSHSRPVPVCEPTVKCAWASLSPAAE